MSFKANCNTRGTYELLKDGCRKLEGRMPSAVLPLTHASAPALYVEFPFGRKQPGELLTEKN